MRKLLLVLIFLGVIGFVAYRGFIYYDRENNCLIKIYPSVVEFSTSNIKRALTVLKNEIPKEYKNVCELVESIDPNPSCGGFEGGCFYEDDEKKIYVTTNQRNLAWTVGVIAHETCHARQFSEGRTMNEDECYRLDDWVLKQIVQY